MAQLVCGGCHTLLMYIRGATSVQCSCCHTVNLALEGSAVSNPVVFKVPFFRGKETENYIQTLSYSSVSQ